MTKPELPHWMRWRVQRDRETGVLFIHGVHPVSGRRFRRSTGTTDLAVALAVLEQEQARERTRTGPWGKG